MYLFLLRNVCGCPTPLPASLDNGNQAITFFLNPDDAKATLDQIKKSNSNLRITTRSLKDAYSVINNNKNKQILFQLLSSKNSVDSARTILLSNGKPIDKITDAFVPVFFGVGGEGKDRGLLTLTLSGEKKAPFFFDLKDLQNLIGM